MKISPSVAIWINVVIALLTAISSGGLSLSGIVSPATAAQIVTLSGAALAIINIAMHAFASSSPGPLAPADPPAVAAAQKVADLTPDDSQETVRATKQAAIDAVQSRNPKLGPA